MTVRDSATVWLLAPRRLQTATVRWCPIIVHVDLARGCEGRVAVVGNYRTQQGRRCSEAHLDVTKYGSHLGCSQAGGPASAFPSVATEIQTVDKYPPRKRSGHPRSGERGYRRQCPAPHALSGTRGGVIERRKCSGRGRPAGARPFLVFWMEPRAHCFSDHQ